MMNLAGTPHYFGPYANWAYSPLPTGSVTSIAVANGGSGYSAPVVTIEDIYVDLYGADLPTGASATASLDSSGAISSITLVDGGSGYTLGSAPRVLISDPTGLGAIASATIDVPAGATPAGGLRKFVDSLPGLSPAGANNLGQYIPVAVPDKTAFPGSDYYEIALVEYTQQMHSDLPVAGTKLRGYVQEKDGVPLDTPHYLGPVIVGQRDVPVRIRFTNRLPTGSAGDLFIPVDTTVMGAGMGPTGMDYTQNRATVHLHGNNTVWISDGTPHQWTTPAGETTEYPKGVSVYNVPDMPDAGPNPPQGVLTFYYTNQHSARLMFYHDHTFGITRLNVLAGEAAGYVITDPVEQDLINGTNVSGVNPGHKNILPDIGIPLVIQDKSFVDAKTIERQDPTWAWGLDSLGNPVTGRIWYPHVYMPNQNPGDASGVNAFGRWDYGPWSDLPTVITHPPVANPYYDPTNAPWEPALMPDIPNPSSPGEAFQDTALVNGTAYPYVNVQPKTYRFRILNAANDRFFNLQLYVADSGVVAADGRTNTEVRMVEAKNSDDFPPNWPADGRAGGVPDPSPALAGPDFIQIGTEGGFLPKPVIVHNQPVTWNMDGNSADAGLVKDHALFLACAERADVLVDFSAYAGKTLILYNDSPAPVPMGDERYDYYTGNPDTTANGGPPSTQAGYGPNTRTIMQIRVASSTPAAPYDLAALQLAFAKTATKRGVFEASQDEVIVPQARYDSAYDAAFPSSAYAGVNDSSMSFQTVAGGSATLPFQRKAIQDIIGRTYDSEYGRMSNLLGLQLSAGGGFLSYPYASPPVDLLSPSLSGSLIGQLGDGTQIWKITHNGVDTHPIHVHLFNVQLINRVASDNVLRLPDDNELGWKETVRVNPMQDTIVALRPILPLNLPFKVPNSVRLLDPTLPEGAPLMEPGPSGFLDPNGRPVISGGVPGILNHYVNFGWEYVYHCHILAHEETDMMHSVAYAVPPEAPSGLLVALSGAAAHLSWTNNALNATGFTLQRATNAAFSTGLTEFSTTGTSFVDSTLQAATPYYYRVVAKNLVGDAADYGPGVGFPCTTATSSASNIAALAALHPRAVLSTSSHVFGSQRLGTSGAAQTLIVSNAGNAPLSLAVQLGGTHPGDFALAQACSGSIAPGGSCSIDSNFVPTAMGGRSAALVISSNDPDLPVQVVDLLGTGVAPLAGLSTSALAFGNQGRFTQSPPQALTLTNTGTDLLNFSVAISGAQPGDFAQSNTCGGSIPAGGTCSISVTLMPTGIGPRSASLAISSDDPFNPLLNVALSGTGTPVPLSATGLAASIRTPSRIRLTWTDASNNEQSFVVWRSTNGGAYLAQATVCRSTSESNSTGGSVTSNDNSVCSGNTYSYYVVAVNTSGNSAASNTGVVNFSVPANPSALTGSAARITGNNSQDRVTLNWADHSGNEVDFQIQRSKHADFHDASSYVIGADTTTFAQNVSRQDDYYYRIRARNLLGNSAWSNVLFVTTP